MNVSFSAEEVMDALLKVHPDLFPRGMSWIVNAPERMLIAGDKLHTGQMTDGADLVLSFNYLEEEPF